jgi:hypothetical protein
MGDWRIFLKSLHDASFNKDLSNEPNFDRIHIAGQYLYLFVGALSQIHVCQFCRQARGLFSPVKL